MIELTESEELTLAIAEARIECVSFFEKRKLYEKVYFIDVADLDMIVAPLKAYIDDLNNIQDKEELKEVFYGNHLETFSSEDLKSPLCKQASAIKPITIQVFDSSQSYYNSMAGKIAIGITSLSEEIVKQWYAYFDTMKLKGKSFQEVLPLVLRVFELTEEDRAYILSLFTERFLRLTIYHELSHWLSDALHSEHLAKGVKASRDKGSTLAQHYKKPDMLFSKLELDAYMNGLYHLKWMVGQDEWDTYSFNDLFVKYPALQAITSDINKQQVLLFKKNLYKRLNREGMLGEGMRQPNP